MNKSVLTMIFAMLKKVKLPEGHYFLAGDFWWRSGFNEHVSKGRIRGKIVGWMRRNEKEKIYIIRNSNYLISGIF